MATQDQIFELRIIINDPEDITSYESYANQGAFPAAGVSGVGYFAEDTGKYYSWNEGKRKKKKHF